ncbi:hypothetical protein KUTeg_007436 [Tegillarca granosa]|uniref:3-hydroxyacyl-CoA dehydrogenase family protein n=1 Tax=Tegillarca granosa TaxID=220873 RepID=A0ABQ9FF87_TEGGR|nr:hypothetical protein KUTeg_007436 [Tegillarca granosa]
MEDTITTLKEMKVAIIGSGNIGRSFAMCFAASGYKVSMYDIDYSQLHGAMKDIKERLEELEKSGLLRGSLTITQQLQRITATDDFTGCVQGAFFIQTNPPFYVPLVEIVPAPWTDKEVTKRVTDLMKEIGQSPVTIKKEIDGFALNRIKGAIAGECWRLIEEDVISVEDIDKVMTDGLGRRYAFMGPLETAYLNADGFYSYADRYAEMIYSIQKGLGPIVKQEGELLERVQSELEAKIPMDKLKEQRQWRDIRLAGLGLIGRSFAMLFAAAGYQVKIYDIEASQITHALSDIWQQLIELQKIGLLRGSLSIEEQHKRIEGTNDITECAKGAFFVIECVPERIELKTGVHAKIDPVVSDTTIIASSASALIPSKISQNLKHRNRFIVVHPTNPPFYAPLVELVPSPWADSDVVPKTKALVEEIGQSPVVLKKEKEGFVLNRIQYSIIKECFNLVKDDIISVEDVDKVMSEGLGRRYAFIGQMETDYLNADGMRDHSKKFAEMSYRLQKSFKPPIKMEGEILDKIHKDIEKRIPLDKLQERRRWRDKRLAALEKMIRTMGKKTY